MKNNEQNQTAIELIDITRSYLQGNTQIQILKNFNLKVKKGEMLAITGPSGCGKSTLLQITGLLDKPDSGKIIIDQQDCSIINERKRTIIRRNQIGFVYQHHHLLQNFSALENVSLPMKLAGVENQTAKAKAQDLLDMLQLSHRSKHWPSALSGGEQQRVAIARAFANSPDIILADEPTGNLDADTAKNVFEILTKMATKDNVAIVMVTHNMLMAEKMTRYISL